MKRQCVVACTMVLGSLVGCQGDRSALSWNTPDLLPPRSEMAAWDTGRPTVERMQKPDSEPVQRTSLSVGSDSKLPSLSHADGQVVAAIRATVNGVPILEQELENASYGVMDEVRSLSEPERSRKVREIRSKILDLLIERELLIQDAQNRFGKGNGAKFMDKIKEAAGREFERQVILPGKKRYGCKDDEEFKSKLRSMGASLEGLQRQFERQFLYQQYLMFLVGPKMDRIGHEQIRDYYDKHPEEFQAEDSVDWQDLFVAVSRFGDDREAAHRFAEELRSKIQAGEDFAQLAQQHDNGYSKDQNGAGIGHRHGEIQPRDAEEVVFGLKDNDVGPLIEMAGGFHIVRVVKRQYAGQLPFDEKTQTAIRDKLRNQVFAREAKRIGADLRAKAAIQITRSNQ